MQLIAIDIANAIRAADNRVVAFFIFIVFILGKPAGDAADTVAAPCLISVGNAAGTVADGMGNPFFLFIFDNNNLQIAFREEGLADVVAMGCEYADEGIKA